MESIGDFLKGFNITGPEEKTKGEHTPTHTLAIELSKFYNEPKKVGFWLGIIKRFGYQPVLLKWKSMIDSTAPRSPGLMIFYLKRDRDQRKKNGETKKRSTDNGDGKV